ncbi:MarR family transcriptional regulator [Anaerotruncus colihominis]|jgi:DNA-binding MarR family transcriptional regulator|uniref:MarR family transcriptional regulator n=2 Tax=Anaerotruncus colihominis TaxID=169435 RepID=A0A845STV3_9FIRM|nr:MarR family transcriptional regulator [Anaerotruncus colihominis]
MSALIEILNMPARKTTFKELEKRLSLAQSTTVGLISRLEQKKLVSVSRDRDDKRIKYVEITSLGEKFCNEARQEMEDTERKLLENLSAGEAETLLSLLKKVNLIIKEL